MNHKKVHIICGMCGNNERMKLVISDLAYQNCDNYHFSCGNCATISSGTDEIQGFKVDDCRIEGNVE